MRRLSFDAVCALIFGGLSLVAGVAAAIAYWGYEGIEDGTLLDLEAAA
jgi:hypothetical protein